MSQRRREDPRLTTFKQYVAAHREIQKAHKELLAAILHSSYDLVFLVGATGVGKTTLLR
jgi:flagellar biosynthesis GTPase FlhF